MGSIPEDLAFVVDGPLWVACGHVRFEEPAQTAAFRRAFEACGDEQRPDSAGRVMSGSERASELPQMAHPGLLTLPARADCVHGKAGYYSAMKLGRLRSIAHNLADSIGSGLGLPIGHYAMDIYGEAAMSNYGYVTIDFLSGEITGGPVSKSLSDAIEKYREALPTFCEKHGMPLDAFHEFVVRFSNGPLGRRFLIMVRDEVGRRSVTEYGGLQSKRLRDFTNLGRLARSDG